MPNAMENSYETIWENLLSVITESGFTSTLNLKDDPLHWHCEYRSLANNKLFFSLTWDFKDNIYITNFGRKMIAKSQPEYDWIPLSFDDLIRDINTKQPNNHDNNLRELLANNGTELIESLKLNLPILVNTMTDKALSYYESEIFSKLKSKNFEYEVLK